MNQNRSKYLLSLFLTTLVVYLSLFFSVNYLARLGNEKKFPVTRGDTEDYVAAADNLYKYQTFSLSTTTPLVADTLRTPGYPLFILAFKSLGGGYLFVSLVQILLTALSAVLLFLMMRRFTGSKMSLFFCLLYILDPNVIWFSFIIMSETLFVFLILLAIYLLFFSCRFVPAVRIVLGGGLIGVAILVRPIAMYLPPVITLFYLWLERKNVKVKILALRVILFAVSCLLILTPWLIRNRVVQGEWDISSAGGFNLLFYNVAEFEAIKNHQDLGLVRQELERETGLVGSFRDPASYTLGNSHKFTTLAEKYILNDPLGYARFHLIKTTPVFLASSFEDTLMNFTYSAGFTYAVKTKPNYSDLLATFQFKKFFSAVAGDPFIIEKIFWFLICLLALAAVWLKRREKSVWLFLALVGYFSLLVGPLAQVRYRLPLEPFLLILAAIGLSGSARSFRGLDFPRRDDNLVRLPKTETIIKQVEKVERIEK